MSMQLSHFGSACKNSSSSLDAGCPHSSRTSSDRPPAPSDARARSSRGRGARGGPARREARAIRSAHDARRARTSSTTHRIARRVLATDRPARRSSRRDRSRSESRPRASRDRRGSRSRARALFFAIPRTRIPWHSTRVKPCWAVTLQDENSSRSARTKPSFGGVIQESRNVQRSKIRSVSATATGARPNVSRVCTRRSSLDIARSCHAERVLVCVA